MSNNTSKTYVFFVLDRSGSMESVKSEVIESVNEQISILKREETSKMKIFASLSMYNEEVEHIFLNKPIFDVGELCVDELKPSGITATYDALDSTIEEIINNPDINNTNTSVLVIILSDGKNDASKKTSQKDISSKINMLQKTGRWTFAYIAANQEPDTVFQDLCIPKGNVLKYEPNSLGMMTMIEKHLKYLVSYFTARSYGTKGTRGFYGSDR